MTILQATSLTKRYGNFCAVDNLSISLNEGEIYGYLGLNGAGKTTTIRMLLDLIKPSEGHVNIFGKQLRSGDDILNQVGYMVETPMAYPELSVRENLKVYLNYRRLTDLSLIGSVIESLDLTSYADIKAKHLSMGNRQRLGLAKALVHRPKLLILDEPTNGLDPAGIVQTRLLLKRLASEGVTIFISSHLLGEISKIATRLGIINKGSLIREIESSQLHKELLRSLIVDTTDNQKAADILSAFPFENINLDDEGKLHAHMTGDIKREIVAEKLVSEGLGLKEFYTHIEDLESYFFRQISAQ